MGLILAGLAQYGLARMGQGAQKSLEREHIARSNALKSLWETDMKSIEAGQGSHLATDVGQQQLRATGLSKDAMNQLTTSSQAYAQHFGGTARGAMTAGTEQQLQAPTDTGAPPSPAEMESRYQQAGQLARTSSTLFPLSAEGQKERLTSATAGLTEAKATTEQQTLEGIKRTHLATADKLQAESERIQGTFREEADLMRATSEKLRGMLAPEKEKALAEAYGIRTTAPAYAEQAQAAGAEARSRMPIHAATAEQIGKQTQLLVPAQADMAASTAELNRATAGQEIPARSKYFESQGGFVNMQTRLAPAHLAIAWNQVDAVREQNAQAFALGMDKNDIEWKNADTAEKRVAIESKQVDMINNYHQSQVKQQQITAAAHLFGTMQALYPNADATTLRAVANYGANMTEDLAPGVKLPPGMNKSMLDERRRLTAQLASNSKAISSVIATMRGKDYADLSSEEKAAHIAPQLKEANTQLYNSVVENTALEGSPYDALSGQDKLNYMLDTMFVFDKERKLPTTAREALQKYTTLTDARVADSVPTAVASELEKAAKKTAAAPKTADEEQAGIVNDAKNRVAQSRKGGAAAQAAPTGPIPARAAPQEAGPVSSATGAKVGQYMEEAHNYNKRTLAYYKHNAPEHTILNRSDIEYFSQLRAAGYPEFDARQIVLNEKAAIAGAEAGPKSGGQQ